MEESRIILGSNFVDDRGEIKFVNGFDFAGVKRFYQVSNHSKGFRRAWHGHKKEAKYVYVTKGSALVCAVPMDTPQYEFEKVQKYILSDKCPRVLYIPAGYYNGFMTLTDDTQILFFSTSTLEESKGDDIRLDPNAYPVWKIQER